MEKEEYNCKVKDSAGQSSAPDDVCVIGELDSDQALSAVLTHSLAKCSCRLHWMYVRSIVYMAVLSTAVPHLEQ